MSDTGAGIGKEITNTWEDFTKNFDKAKEDILSAFNESINADGSMEKIILLWVGSLVCILVAVTIYFSIKTIMKNKKKNKMSLIPGDLAPDFTLDSVDGEGMVEETLSLESMKGKCVVLLFPPVDFSLTPFEEYPPIFSAYHHPIQEDSLDQIYEYISEEGFLLIISTEVASLVKFQDAVRSEGIPRMKLLYDPTGEVAQKYGVYKEEENIRSRALFMIDPKGKIVYSSWTLYPNMGLKLPQ